MDRYAIRFDCRLCRGVVKISLDMGMQPLANSYPTERIEGGQEHFPLYLSTCQSCGHVQLPVVVNPELLFRDYAYVSSTSPVFVQHLKDFARDVQPVCAGLDTGAGYSMPARADKFIVEIGSNDGTLLREYARLGYSVLGVDPARNLSFIAMTRGVPTVVDYFEERVARLVGEQRKADLIIALNVFAHADDLAGIARAVKELLAPGGLFALEVGYLPDMIERGLYRLAYHEHASFHHLTALALFFERHGLELFDAHRVPTQGGSVRCFVRHANAGWRSARLTELLAAETPGAINVAQLATRIHEDRERIQAKLAEWRAQGKTVAGYGAPAQLTPLMYALRMTDQDVQFICDDNPIKQGRFTPGLFIPIVHPDELVKRQPDVCLVFSSNFADDIRTRNQGFLGEWVNV